MTQSMKALLVAVIFAAWVTSASAEASQASGSWSLSHFLVKAQRRSTVQGGMSSAFEISGTEHPSNTRGSRIVRSCGSISSSMMFQPVANFFQAVEEGPEVGDGPSEGGREEVREIQQTQSVSISRQPKLHQKSRKPFCTLYRSEEWHRMGAPPLTSGRGSNRMNLAPSCSCSVMVSSWSALNVLPELSL